MWNSSLAEPKPAGAHPKQATFLELFFDLVFVFALTRIVARAYENLAIEPGGSALSRALPGAGKTLLLLLALYALWQGTAWTTSRYDPDSTAIQVVVMVALGAGLVMGVTIPRAFTGYAEAFAFAYVIGHLTRPLVLLLALRDRQRRLLKVRMLITYCATGVLWIVGGIINGLSLIPLWILALGVEYAAGRFGWPTPRLGRSTISRWDIAGEHLAERYHQFFLIALGETILVIGLTYSTGPFDRDHTAAFAAAAFTSVLLWRIYFYRAGHILSEAITKSSNPAHLARSAANSHLVMIIGVVVTALGYEITIEDPFGHAPPTWIAPILLGPALFIAGRARFEYEVFGRVSRARVVTLIALILPYPALLPAPPLAATIVTAVVLAGAAAADARRAWNLPPEPAKPPI
ncbi:Low temperature requirement protein LtrA [Micromonospora rhizosphaerae]|uniref:Low temperature requirement protein LtrA n=1 Tax=Micromonospora rhizosphaerae TaxID=568872 RepID=A0A1C6RJW3_9ACTN|nr:low temperature requirement protein A [Micromonospora rhizosphaerae]SCL17479.1 Low temperature requirement protein LtrA [Micromonospora rhizosphaerae]